MAEAEIILGGGTIPMSAKEFAGIVVDELGALVATTHPNVRFDVGRSLSNDAQPDGMLALTYNEKASITDSNTGVEIFSLTGDINRDPIDRLHTRLDLKLNSIMREVQTAIGAHDAQKLLDMGFSEKEASGHIATQTKVLLTVVDEHRQHALDTPAPVAPGAPPRSVFNPGLSEKFAGMQESEEEENQRRSEKDKEKYLPPAMEALPQEKAPALGEEELAVHNHALAHNPMGLPNHVLIHLENIRLSQPEQTPPAKKKAETPELPEGPEDQGVTFATIRSVGELDKNGEKFKQLEKFLDSNGDGKVQQQEIIRGVSGVLQAHGVTHKDAGYSDLMQGVADKFNAGELPTTRNPNNRNR